ncbi:disease resistance protein RPV1-like isoform X2 [Gastrolobium bilobum]|uniref:disease resistance protein RPV1-like isoform X2 n=1 Tax=Gastrolobium bilobum TaxID=150636 RepID=UPI002AB0B0AD|nr:disease resistance protein RPV1-like isoform X2 [Gastrolobium bilobum]
MESMSSSSFNGRWIYDVFLSFRGKDTRNSFVSHLHASLSNAGINTFLDDEKLEKGTELGPELLRAIERSQISIVVFSETYTESSWCLNELVKIMECHRTYGQVVLPVFYGVEPTQIRYQMGALGEAMEKLARKKYSGKNMTNVWSRWRTTLTEAANLSGWEVTTSSNQAKVAKLILEEVLTKLDNTLLSITEFPVGLETRVGEVIGLLENQSSKVCMLGIWGMGGSGKTTTAKAIYNQIHRKFEGTSFIENIREVCEKDSRGYIDLQEQLISDVLKTKVKIHSIAMGTTVIERRLCGKRALIVLDDVNEFEQLKALCGNRKWIGSGSVLIVTTRDVRLLNVLKVDHVHRTKEMDENESLELFSWHAFREASPREDLIELSRNIVAYCGGLPLALEVLGSYLYERTEQEWRSVLSKLEIIPNDQVQEKLRISFDGLRDDMEKDIFLDICCFFIGKDRDYVTDILNGCGLHADIGLTVLIERSLIKVEKNNKLGIHALLRDMGREIVRESSAKNPEKRSRLWFQEDVLDVLTKNTGTETVEGLALKMQRTDRVCFSSNAFKEMKRMRLLQFDHVELNGDYGYLSEQLRWVNWQRFPLEYIPDNFYLGNLVAIELKHSNIKKIWKEPKLLGRLKILNLSHSRFLTNTPDFSKLPNLEKLILKDCPSLIEVHQSIGDLSKLLLINLKNCTSLTNLPRRIYELKSVKTLILSGCSKIDKLEEDIVHMESLTTLIANNTAVKQDNNFGNLSPMLGNLPKLRSVWVQCSSECQLTQELRRILDDLYDVYFAQLGASSYASQNSDLSLRSLLIGMGSYHMVIDILGKSISQELTTNRSNDVFLPGDNCPSWLAYTCAGHSVVFQVPEDGDCRMKGMILCVVYSSKPENMAAECLISVLIINYTKCTILIHKRDTAMSFNDEDWQGVISNLEPGDTVEIFVAFGHGLTAKKTAVYVIYGQSITVEVEPSINVEMEPPPELNAQLSPSVEMEPASELNSKPSPSVEMEPASELNSQPSHSMEMEPASEFNSQLSYSVEMEPSPEMKTDPSPELNSQPPYSVEMELSPEMKTEPSPKPNKSIFARLTKRMGECLCLNQN